MNQSIPKVMLRALILSYILSGLMILALSFALYKLKLKEAQINLAILAVQGLACLIGGLSAGKGIRSRRFFWGLISGLLYFIILFAASFVLNRGRLPDSSRSMTVLACCAAGGILGGILS